METSSLTYPPSTAVTYADPANPQHFSKERMEVHEQIIRDQLVKTEQAIRDIAVEQNQRDRKKVRAAAWEKTGTRAKGEGKPPPPDAPTASTEQPVLLVIAGGPGSGKSVLSAWLKKQKIFDGKFLAVSSETFAGLPEFKTVVEQTGHPHPEKSPTLKDEYYHLRTQFLERCIEKKLSLVIDDHFADPVRDRQLVERAKKAGYLTVMVGLTPQPFPYFEQIVPTEKYSQHNFAHTPWMLKLHASFQGRWEDMARVFDYSFLYQNLFQKGKLAKPLALIAAFDSQHYDRPIRSFVDEEHYVRFGEWKKINTDAKTFEDAFPPRNVENDAYFLERMGGAPERGGASREFYLGAGLRGDGKEGFVDKLMELSKNAIRKSEIS